MDKKIIFMGTPIFAANILEELIAAGYKIDLVVSQPDKKVGRKQLLTPTPVKEVAVKHNIDVFQPARIREDFQPIVDFNPDLIITAAYGQIVPDQVLNSPKIECINVHGSLLPKYRGGAPIHFSVLNGDEKTGVTIMKMVSKMDAGAIISQAEFPIEENDTTADVHDKMIGVGANLLLNTLPSIFDGTYTLTEQDEEQVTYSPNISKEQERIIWTKTAKEVHNQIRGLSTWPGAYTNLDSKRFKIYMSNLTDIDSTGNPGTIASVTDETIYVNCNDKQIKLIKVQPAGKKQMETRDFVRGIDKQAFLGKVFE
ncbi:methionyl-tRNA formyltransferase [Mollicutes bacterium LVI A0078]|nr:methionyl-tRNA formyltransferase [Mollicutes bacterium LVI A0075]WOO91666.1 methionyl-tRNA formyltransferase [Mollicutes bacterium LVI A0078]